MSMSGKEGPGKLKEAVSFLRQKAAELSWGKPASSDSGSWGDFLWASSQSVIGLAVRADTVLYLRLQAEKGDAGKTGNVLRLVSEPREAQLSLGEQVHMRAMREGWQELPFALCLASEDILLYKTELPPHLTEREEQEAARWELDARLTESGFDADAYAMAVRRCAGNSAERAGDFQDGPERAAGQDAVDEAAGHTYWLAAAPLAELKSWQDDFAGQGLSLRGFAALAPLGQSEQEQGTQSVPALYLPAFCAAAALFHGKSALGFLISGRQLPARRCRYRRLAALTLLVTLTVLSVWSFLDARAYFQAQADFRQQKQETALLHRDQKIMQMTKHLQERVSERDQRVAMLMETSLPWYSVMVHLGKPELQTEGVWLQEILLRQDRKIEISGMAMSYAALSTFLQSFEQDRAFFTQGPMLEESSAEEKAIRFRMSVSL